MLGRALITVGTLAAVLCQLEGCAAPGGTIHVDLLLFPGPESILRAERQRLLTFSHLIFSFEPSLITSFQGDAVLSVTLARFLRPFSCYGGSLSSSTSGADRPLPGTVPLFRAFCRGV